MQQLLRLASVTVTTATGTLGVIGAGWVASKALMPLRILATLALTPMIAAVVGRFKKPVTDTDEEDDEDEDEHDAAPQE